MAHNNLKVLMGAGLAAFFASFTATALQGTQSGAPEFPNELRQQFMAGFQSEDKASLDKALKSAAERLKQYPGDPVTLVWHGAGIMYKSGDAYQADRLEEAMELWRQGLGEMDRAVKAAPGNLEVRLTRGAGLLEVSRAEGIPDPASELLARVKEDYEAVEAHPAFAHLPVEPRAMVLSGLGEVHARQSSPVKARAFYERLLAEAPVEPHKSRAAAWIEQNPAN
jgi:tetratricopeptide (TPR) repeat protein